MVDSSSLPLSRQHVRSPCLLERLAYGYGDSWRPLPPVLRHFDDEEEAVSLLKQIIQRNPHATTWEMSKRPAKFPETVIEYVIRKYPTLAPWLFRTYPWLFELSIVTEKGKELYGMGQAISNAILHRGTNQTIQDFFELYPQGLSSTFQTSLAFRYDRCTPLEYIFGEICTECVYFDSDYLEFPETSPPENLEVPGQDLEQLLWWLVEKTPRSAPIDTFPLCVQCQFERAIRMRSIIPGAPFELFGLTKKLLPRFPRMLLDIELQARYLPLYCRNPDLFAFVKTTLRLKHLYNAKTKYPLFDVDDEFFVDDINRLEALVKEEVSIFQTNGALFQAHSQLIPLEESADEEDPKSDLQIFVTERVEASQARIAAIRSELEEIRQHVKVKRVQYEFDGNTWWEEE